MNEFEQLLGQIAVEIMSVFLIVETEDGLRSAGI